MINLGTVTTYAELKQAIRGIVSHHSDSQILFRGQRELYESVRSGRGRPSYTSSSLVESGWRAFATKLLGLTSASSVGLEQSILQHYGYETFFIDLTTDLRVASWFASNDYSQSRKVFVGNRLRLIETVNYTQANTGKGYLLIFAIPNAKQLMESGRLFDLSTLNQEFVRPHAQSGWLLMDRPPTRPVPDDFLVATIKIDLNTVKIGNLHTLFPKADNDPAYAKMRELPYIQFDPYNKSKEGADSDIKLEYAIRILNLPEHSHNEENKWNDVTIYEPTPMREWQSWRADLKNLYGDISGNIKDTTKITISPTALKIIQTSKATALEWPQLNKSGLFFTFAALDHDKLIDHSPPYAGVWLQKDDSLIIETPMEADEDTLSTGMGHGYFLKNGRLERQEMEKSCECLNPESHDLRVTEMLRIQNLVQNGDLILLPHPYHSKDWFFVITGDERKYLSKDIEKTSLTHQYIMKSLKASLHKPKKRKDAR